jgi:SAM-dependent methyltransferase
MTVGVEFDEYAGGYETALAEGLRFSGEDSIHFARERIGWLRARLDELDASSRTVIDFGCGTGSATGLLADILNADRVIGTDVSSASLARARAEHASDRTEFRRADASLKEWADVAYCNGVFHHIAPADRPQAVAWVRRALRPGGLFALWENNPWNPGTRLVMSQIPFDRHAITLPPPNARAMLLAGGFEIVRTDSRFYFPRALRALRRFEPRLCRLPLGAQYMVLARRPD